MTVLYSVTKPDTVSDPSYAPDGESIIFVENISSTYKISTLTLGATPVYTVLQSGSLPYADPYYSADGHFIVFAQQTGAVTGPNPKGQWSILYMNADGSGLTIIINDGNANIHPCWVTPTQIAFQWWQYGATPSSVYQISLIDLAGMGRVNLGEGEYPRVVVV